MKLFRVIILTILLFVGLANAEDNTTFANDILKQTVTDSSKSIINGIKEIQSLKKDTFESTDEFTHRRNKNIEELNNKVIVSAKKGSDDYNAGTVTMESYDADKERIKLDLAWNKELVQLLPEIKKQKIVSIIIPRDAAKKLFSKKNTHFFHIKVSYSKSKLILSEITLLDKYQLYGNPKTKKMVTPEKKIEIEEDESWSLWVWVLIILVLDIIIVSLIFKFRNEDAGWIAVGISTVLTILGLIYIIWF